jgi:RNA polymerase sigma factor (sigma-70 family)
LDVTYHRDRLQDVSSSELIRLAQHDPDAFGVLFDRYAIPLRQWLLANTGDVAAANDLLAETFARAWRSRRRFRGESEDAGGAWLFGIARNLQRQHHRRGRVEKAQRDRLGMRALSTCEDESDAAVARLDAERFTPSVRAAFAKLSPEQRQAIGYRVLGDLSYQEVAHNMNTTTTTARTRVHRGLRALRSAIEKGADA